MNFGEFLEKNKLGFSLSYGIITGVSFGWDIEPEKQSRLEYTRLSGYSFGVFKKINDNFSLRFSYNLTNSSGKLPFKMRNSEFWYDFFWDEIGVGMKYNLPAPDFISWYVFADLNMTYLFYRLYENIYPKMITYKIRDEFYFGNRAGLGFGIPVTNKNSFLGIEWSCKYLIENDKFIQYGNTIKLTIQVALF